MATYQDKLKDPRWQRRRLEIMERDCWACEACGETGKTLHVHHYIYGNGEPWQDAAQVLGTLCEDCHGREHERREASDAALVKTLSALRVPVGEVARFSAALANAADMDPKLPRMILAAVVNGGGDGA